MSQSEINLKDLQQAVVGVPKDLILPEDYSDNARELKQQSIRKIVNMYTTCRSNDRIYKSTYDALTDDNPYVRVAAVDLIGRSGTENSFEFLFQALEDEDNVKIKQEIARAIDRLESKLNSNDYVEEETHVSFMKSMRILSGS